ncbi:hypothetical protein KSP40_PGU005103 [Platanthera guangdongensis]|uniref:Uncharacterized protein n=1 Tax=Platanthera guangdongensis TaxID=2320717 RepID=A0ABR2M7R6_9ASPA
MGITGVSFSGEILQEPWWYRWRSSWIQARLRNVRRWPTAWREVVGASISHGGEDFSFRRYLQELGGE